jgi:HPt (histidine-containing phosphotransfer) domain-containing protein
MILEAATSNTPLFKPEVLERISHVPSDRAEILRGFIEDTRHDIFELERAIASEDFVRAARIAHCIKGASSMVGAAELTQICAYLEMRSNERLSPDPAAVKIAFSRLTTCLLGYLGD